MSLFATFALAALLTPQPPPQAPPPAFDAASIRTSTPLPFKLKTNPGRLSATSASLAQLIQTAYGLQSLQVAGVPSLGSFDIEATAAGSHTRAELLAMLQTLLAERFKLAVHREMREMPVMALIATKAWKGTPAASPDGDPTLGLRGDTGRGTVRSVYFDGQSTTLAFIANYVAPRVGRVVIDQTGLIGAFDFHVTVPIDAERVADRSIPEREVANEIVADFIDKLGLKLEPRRAMVEILVVDHAEQPGEN